MAASHICGKSHGGNSHYGRSHCSKSRNNSHLEKYKVHKKLKRIRQVTLAASHIVASHITATLISKIWSIQKIGKNAASHIFRKSHCGKTLYQQVTRKKSHYSDSHYKKLATIRQVIFVATHICDKSHCRIHITSTLISKNINSTKNWQKFIKSHMQQVTWRHLSFPEKWSPQKNGENAASHVADSQIGASHICGNLQFLQ